MRFVCSALVITAVIFVLLCLLELLEIVSRTGMGRWCVAIIRLGIGLGSAAAAVLIATIAAWEGVAVCVVAAAALGLGLLGVNAVRDVFIHDAPITPPDVWIDRSKVEERTDTSARALLSGRYAAGTPNTRVTVTADISFTAAVPLVVRERRWFVREVSAVR